MKNLFSKKYKLANSEKLAIIEGLSLMLSAGVPILEAFDSISEDIYKKNTREVVDGLSSNISSGKTLAEAMQVFPDTFDSVTTSIIKAGETGGKLEIVLGELAVNIKSDIETSNNIRSAIFYPALIFVILVVLTFYMFAFALPKIANVFLDLAIELPLYSTIILNTSLFFQNYWVYIALLFFIFSFLIYQAFNIPKVRIKLIGILSIIPVLKLLVKNMDLARFTGTSALLLSSGIPIIEVLQISKGVVLSSKLSGDIDFVSNSLSQGSNLSNAMKQKTKSFPALLRRIVGVGEETGKLDQSLANVSNHYRKSVEDIMKNLTVLLEPVLLIIIGIVVGIVLLSVVAPIYQLIGGLSPK